MWKGALRLLLLAALLAGCGQNLDSEMWECQLSVQKGNAGKDAEAAAERSRDIEACMDQRGFRLDAGKPDCRDGSVDSSCYVAK